MNNTIEFIVKMKNLMGGELTKLSTTSHNSFSKITNQVDTVTKHNKVLENSFNDVQKKIVETGSALKNSNLQKPATSGKPALGGVAGEGTLASSIGGGLVGGLKMLGVGFAAFKGLELIHEGIESVERLHQAQAQVKAGLESTGYAAGVTSANLDSMAKSFSSNTKYSRADITELQSLILTFPAITKQTFPEATQAILDMSTRLGQDTKSSAIQLGKALQDPILGITALRRVGVNFSDSQKDVIQKLVDTGQKAKAQQIILKELTTEFGGSARAAFDADPLAKYNKMMASMKMALGEAGMMILETTQPALLALASGVKWVAEKIKALVHWLEENKELARSLAIFVGILSGAYFLNITYLKLLEFWQGAVAGSTLLQTFRYAALTVGMEGANIAGMTLAGTMAVLNAINPLVWVAAAVAGVIYLYKTCDKFRANIEGIVSVVNYSLEFLFKNFGRIFGGIGHLVLGIATFNVGEIKQGFESLSQTFKEGGFSIAKAFKEGYSSVIDNSPKSVLRQWAQKNVDEINNGNFKNLADYQKKVNEFKAVLDRNVKAGVITEYNEKNVLKHLKGYKSHQMAAANEAAGEQAGDTVTGGGPKVVNINVGKFFDNLQFTTLNTGETVDQMEKLLIECLARVVYQGSKLVN